MIIKDKNKLKSNTTPVVEQSSLRGRESKILVLGLIILIALVGFFGMTSKVNAQQTEVCWTLSGTTWLQNPLSTIGSKTICEGPPRNGKWQVASPQATAPQATIPGQCVNASGIPNGKNQTDCTTPDRWQADTVTPTTTPEEQSAFATAVEAKSCITLTNFDMGGCAVKFAYYVLYLPSAFLLWASAYFFNVLISITLSSKLFTQSAFIPTAWGVVRDLSNLFFILILLYIAIKMILGLGGSDVKKMISKVIIIALLINFSMFFTKVVIDTSNILALVFYNKLNVQTSDTTGKDRDYISAQGEKDVAGGMVNAFNPTTMLTTEFFTKAGTQEVPGTPPVQGEVPFGIMIGITLVAIIIMLFAAYCFFIAGISFVSRLIELWILIIFSPFAFMSSSAPFLEKTSYIGWDDWFKRLLSVSFMAPIFMFFMYFIFLLLSTQPNIFGNMITKNDSLIGTMLLVVIPALIILILLLQATDFAKKGSGKLGQMMMNGAKMVGGLALGAAGGAALGGVAMLGRAGIGRAGAAMASSEWAKKREAQGKFGSGVFRDVTSKIGSGSFDVRGVKIGGKTLAGATGMNLGEAQKGGFTERKKEQVEKRQKRAKELEVGEGEELKQKLNKTETDLQSLLDANSKELTELDKMITKRREALNDTTARFGGGSTEAKQAGLDLQNAKNKRKALKDGVTYWGDEDLAGRITAIGGKDYSTNEYAAGIDPATGRKRTMNYMEDIELRDRKQDVVDENRRRKRSYADSQQTGWSRTKGYVLSGGAYTKAASQEAAHRIRMDAKVEEKK